MTEPHVLPASLDAAHSMAVEAASLALEGFRSGVEVRKKGEIDLLTDYDLRCEALIRRRLSEHFPTHAVVGEEGEDTGSGELVWYVDPIDGTTNYAHGHPFFSVSLALYRGAEGLVGVVAAPALDVAWSGAKGLGAFRNGKPSRVSGCTDLGEALCATGFPYDRRTAEDDNMGEYVAFLKRTHGIRRGGSAAIDLAMVSDGTFDAYWEQRLNAWDMCAGALLILEAGGKLSDYDGSEGDPRSGRLVATNGSLHAAVLDVLREARSGQKVL